MMKIPQSAIEPFGYTGIPTIPELHDRIDDALFEAWMEIWNKEECRGASMIRITAFLKRTAEKYGAHNVHCQTGAAVINSKKTIIVWYKLPSGEFKGTRLFFP